MKCIIQIDNNRGQFRRPEGVHKPVMMLIDPTDRRYVDHLERIVGKNRLTSFVCEEWDDCLTLMQARDVQGFRINVVLQTPDLGTNGRQVR